MKLAALYRQYHLAVSLHAPTEALRNTLVPVNEKIGLNAVLTAADAYFERTGRQVTYEYVLLRGLMIVLPMRMDLRTSWQTAGARESDPL